MAGGDATPGRRLRKRLQGPLRAGIFYGFKLLHGIFRLVGPGIGRRAGRLIGRFAGVVLPFERRIVDENLKQAFPSLTPAERHRIRRQMFAHLGESAVELLFPERVLVAGRCEIEGLEELQAALSTGSGVIVVTGHIGNWEILAAEVGRRGIPLTVVARRLFDDRFDSWMRHWRLRYGIETLTRDEPNAVKTMLRALRGNRVVGLLIDQDTGVPSVWVPFFGRMAKTPDAAARLARRGTAVFVGGAQRIGPYRHRLTLARVDPLPDDPIQATTILSAALQLKIEQAPEQWVWLHRRWKSPPPDPQSGQAASR